MSWRDVGAWFWALLYGAVLLWCLLAGLLLLVVLGSGLTDRGPLVWTCVGAIAVGLPWVVVFAWLSKVAGSTEA